LGKRKAADETVTTVHRLVYGRPGDASKRKADLRQFNGFPPATDMKGISDKLGRHQVSELKDLCVFLNLEQSGEKSTITQRIVAFLLKPVDFGASKPVKKATKKKSNAKSPRSKAAKVSETSKSPGHLEETEDQEVDEGEDSEDDEIIKEIEAESETYNQ